MKDVGVIERFYALFAGNPRCTGRYAPKTNVVTTEYLPVTEQDITLHLAGIRGVGVAPIMDDDTVRWCALNMNPQRNPAGELSLVAVADRIEAIELPLLPCRSRSGGVHAFAFFQQPTAAAKAIAMCAEWRRRLGVRRTDSYPKEATLRDREALRFPSYLMLPYLGGDGTERYCWHKGRRLMLASFLDGAKAYAISEQTAEETLAEEPRMPVLSGLVKRLYPRYVRWSVAIDGHRVDHLTTTELFSWHAMRACIAERLTRVAPDMPGRDWDRTLQGLMRDVTIIDMAQPRSIQTHAVTRALEEQSDTEY